MESLIDILEAAKKASGASSDSDLARKMGVAQPTFANWRSGRSTPDAYALMELQKILKKDARELLAIIEAERAKDSTRREYWIDVKKSFRTTSAAALACLALLLSIGHVEKAEASAYLKMTPKMYIMSSYVPATCKWLNVIVLINIVSSRQAISPTHLGTINLRS